MTTMYLINEENHGNLAVAWNRTDAIVWLISTKWLNEEIEVWNNCNDNGEMNGKTLKELGWWDKVFDLTIEQLEWCGFYLTEIEVAP